MIQSDERPGQRPRTDGDRHGETCRLIETMRQTEVITEGQFNSLGLLITDASLCSDEPTLVEIQDGLQWIYRRHLDVHAATTGEQHEQRGRIRGLINVVHWALRRLPSGLQLNLVPDSHAARLLIAVARHPGMSNREIAAELGTDETEVSRVGRRLLAAGVVWRRKEWRRNAWDITPRGRQYLETSGLLSGLCESKYAIGISVLPDRLVGVVSDPEAKVLSSRPLELACQLPPEETVSQVAFLVDRLLEKSPATVGEKTVDLGVAFGGQVCVDNGEVLFAPNFAYKKEWQSFPLRERIEAVTGLRTVVENDANALAHYEYSFGSRAGTECFATVLLGAGVGCGLVVNGQVMHGATGVAGELGHVIVEPEGRDCGCGNKGCLESVVGATAIAEIVRELSKSPASDFASVLELARDRETRKWTDAAFARAGTALGRGIADLVNLMNPEKLIVYGPPQLVDDSAHQTAKKFMKGVEREVERHVIPAAQGTSKTELIARQSLTFEVAARAASSLVLGQTAPAAR